MRPDPGWLLSLFHKRDRSLLILKRAKKPTASGYCTQKSAFFRICTLWLFTVTVPNICGASEIVPWPIWEKFKQYYINPDGRVIDPQTPNKITTSEGQSYGLFFALVAQDKILFDKMLQWTADNLAAGDLSKRLPAWEWGKNNKNQWVVLDSNSAADSDLWIAYDLLEAGRLWSNAYYTSLGNSLLRRILREEVVQLPGFGLMLLPGKTGFTLKKSWRINPSYLPPQLLARFSSIDSRWKKLERNARLMLLDSSPKGFAPDWIMWKKGKGWQPDQKHPDIGGYDAIRVYLWVGMLALDSPRQSVLVNHFLPFSVLTQKLGAPPEQINVLTGQTKGIGPVGFSAALLPLLANNIPESAAQRQRINAQAFSDDNYYTSVLRLFGQGWDDKRYRFNAQGQLLLP